MAVEHDTDNGPCACGAWHIRRNVVTELTKSELDAVMTTATLQSELRAALTGVSDELAREIIDLVKRRRQSRGGKEPSDDTQ